MLRSFDGSTFFGEQYGDGKPVVLGLHGWARSHDDLRQSLSGLDAISLDLPGFGASPAPPHGWSTLDYAVALDPVIDSMQRPIVIAGHSFGGRVAVHVAARRPKVVAGLVLTGVPLLHRTARPTQPSKRVRIARVLARLKLMPHSRLDLLRERLGSDDYRNSSGVMREVLVKAVNESYQTQLESLTCPVELVWGDRDTAAPAEIATRAETMIARATLTIVGNVDHFLPITHPEPMRQAIRRRLEERRT